MLRLTRIQNELFPDYKFLERYLDTKNEANKKRSPMPPMKELLSKSRKTPVADHDYIPMSYSGIVDLQQQIKIKVKNPENPKSAYLQQVDNPYYDVIKAKVAIENQKKEIFEKES